MEARFPQGVPSLLECTRLLVKGDVKFGSNVTLKGDVPLVNESCNQLEIADYAVIEGGTNGNGSSHSYARQKVAVTAWAIED